MDNRMLENKTIIDTLMFLEYGKFSERKKYLKDFHNDGVSLNGFVFQADVWCWIVWKPTDIGKNPEYKGESLFKVIPNTINEDKIGVVLDSQHWTYP